MHKTTQKIIKIGSSYGVTIPKKELDEHGAKPGDKVELRWHVVKARAKPEDKKVLDAAKNILDTYEEDFRNLADR